MKNEKHIIYTTDLDYKAGEEYIDEESKELESVLKELAEKNWLGGVLARTCEKEIENQKLGLTTSEGTWTRKRGK